MVPGSTTRRGASSIPGLPTVTTVAAFSAAAAVPSIEFSASSWRDNNVPLPLVTAPSTLATVKPDAGAADGDVLPARLLPISVFASFFYCLLRSLFETSAFDSFDATVSLGIPYSEPRTLLAPPRRLAFVAPAPAATWGETRVSTPPISESEFAPCLRAKTRKRQRGM